MRTIKLARYVSLDGVIGDRAWTGGVEVLTCRHDAVDAYAEALALTANGQEQWFLAGRRAELDEDGPPR